MTRQQLQLIKRNFKRWTPLQFCPVCQRNLPLGHFRGSDNRLNDVCNDCRLIYTNKNPKIKAQ